MIKSGALYLAIAISVIIAVLSGSIITLMFHYQCATNQLYRISQSIRDAKSGMLLLVNLPKAFPINSTQYTNLYDDTYVTINRKSWGVLVVLTSTSNYLNYTNSLSFLSVGTNNRNSTMLYLTDHSKPIQIGGNTNISGDCSLPSAGVTRAYVEGTNYSGEKLIHGHISASTISLPKIDRSLMANISSTLSFDESRDSIVSEEILERNDTIYNSFANKSLWIKLKQASLKNKTLIGNIKLIAENDLTLPASFAPDNVIIYSNNIQIENRFTGRLQLFSSGSITLENNCELLYPSTICNLNVNEGQVRIGNESIICGTIISLTKNGEKPCIVLTESTIVTGQIYASGNISLTGTIHGKLIAHSVSYQGVSRLYDNHILNTTIDLDIPENQAMVSLCNTPIKYSKILRL